jgi:hypothetical protein
MKKDFLKTQGFTFLTILFIGTSCNAQIKKDLPKEKEKISESKIISDRQPKLIKTQRSQKSDNVHCSLQDRVGNLCFGTTVQSLTFKRLPILIME